MSVRLYDDAIVEKVKSWIIDKDLKVLSPDDTARLFQMKADINYDEPLKLPLIAISRDPGIELGYKHKKPMSFDGMMLDANYSKSLQIDAIPMTLSYQLDIYTRYTYEADEYMRNFIFNFVNHPKIKVHLPYNGVDYEHWGNINLASTIEDNSDVPQRLFPDQFVRWTIRFTIDDAYMFSLPYKDNVHVVDTKDDIILNKGE